MQAVVSNLLTSYTRAGKGKTVLILHGWADSSASWQSVARELAKDYDVIALDLPGFGASQPPQAVWGLDDYAMFVTAFISKLGLKPHAVVGHSNGGAIAIRGIAKGYISTKKLVLLASAGVRERQQGKKVALRAVTKLGKVVATPLPKQLKRELRRKLYTTIGSDYLIAEHLQDSFKKIVADDVRADAAKLTCQTLLVYGDDDDQTPLRHGELLHTVINGSQLQVVPGAGHFLHLEHEAQILQYMRSFLA